MNILILEYGPSFENCNDLSRGEEIDYGAIVLVMVGSTVEAHGQCNVFGQPNYNEVRYTGHDGKRTDTLTRSC